MGVRRSELVGLMRLQSPVWVFDLEAERMWLANDAALELFGAESLGALQARQAREPMSEGMRRRLLTYAQHFEAGKGIRERWTFYPENQEPVSADCLCSGLDIADDAGTRRGMLVEARVGSTVVGDELRLVEALRHCDERISLYRLDGEVLLRNPSAEQTLGLIGTGDFASTFANPDEAEEARAAAEGHGVFRREVAVRSRQGPAWHDVEVRRVVDPVTGEAALLAVQHDITARRHNEVQLERARQTAEQMRAQAEAASRAKSSFLATMSHELRTPMTGVLTAAELLRTSSLDRHQREILDMVLEAGRQMVALVNEVLDISRIEAGRVEVDPQPIALVPLVRGCLRPLTGAAQAKSLVLRESIEDDVWPWVTLDGQRVTQVLTNLVSNAIKYCDEGTIEVAVRMDEAVDEAMEEAACLVFSVRDEGPGIEPDRAHTIFEPFTRLEENNREGAGLGLHIAKSLVELMGGSLTLDTEVGRGSTFSFSLPVGTATEQPAGPASAPVELALDVLIAEDNQLNRRALVRLLKQWGCRAIEAADGREALDCVRAARPDLVLMDIDMPVMDGVTAARELRRSPATAELPIVALTADAFFSERHPDDGTFAAVLAKPVDWELLRDVLSRWSGA